MDPAEPALAALGDRVAAELLAPNLTADCAARLARVAARLPALRRHLPRDEVPTTRAARCFRQFIFGCILI